MSYVVQMWLTCTSSTPEAIIEFGKRWTPALQNAWSAIQCVSNNLADLAAELNNKILADCKQQIANDMTGGNPSLIDGIAAYDTNVWSTSGGYHSGSHAVNVVPTVGPTLQWSFTAGTLKVYINVCAVFNYP
jgi:hypothetical protein